MSLRIRAGAAAVAAAVILTAGCNKKPEETTILTTPSESVTVTETSETETTEETTESSQETETEPAPPAEYGSGAFSSQAGNVIFKNSINVDAAIHGYEGVKGLDTGWHGSKWIDITKWLTEFHSYKIDDAYLKGASADKRYHKVQGKNGIVINFVPAKEIGINTYDGFDTPAEVPVTLVNIEITLADGTKIVIAGSGDQDDYEISGSGRGWFMTHGQIVAAEYLFEMLEKDASKDPLSEILDHQTVDGSNFYTF